MPQMMLAMLMMTLSECGDDANLVHNGTVTDAQETDHDIMMMIMMLHIAMVSLTEMWIMTL